MLNDRPIFSATSHLPGPGGWYASAPVAPDEIRPADEVDPGVPGAAEDICHRCDGTGVADGLPCADCAGTGKVTVGIGGG